MTLWTLLMLALALAMDAFAVAIGTGIQLRKVGVAQTMRMAGTFGFFQFAMPVIGWFLGVGVRGYIEAVDHWVAFALLAVVGAHMLKEAWDHRGQAAETPPAGKDPTRGRTVLLLGVATSIDALAVGLSIALLDVRIWLPALVIGAVCFAVTACGLHLGRWAQAKGGLGDKAGALGGVVLIVIGLNILREHGVFG